MTNPKGLKAGESEPLSVSLSLFWSAVALVITTLALLLLLLMIVHGMWGLGLIVENTEEEVGGGERRLAQGKAIGVSLSLSLSLSLSVFLV